MLAWFGVAGIILLLVIVRAAIRKMLPGSPRDDTFDSYLAAQDFRGRGWR